MSPRLLKPRLYTSPIALSEARVGRFAIVHHTFTPGNGGVALVSLREAFLTGRKPVQLRITKPMLIHQLVEYRANGVEGVWMSDEPQELRQCAEWLRSVKPRGRVLVGGLGLGVVASWLARLPTVRHVEVVELEQDVVDLVAVRQSGYTVRRDDIAEFLRRAPEWLWDFAFLDTWRGTNEATWWDTVMPLRRIVGNRFGRQRVHCWAEDMMLGQVRRAFFVGNRSTQQRLGGEGLRGVADPIPAQTNPEGVQRTEVVLRPFGREWHYEGFPEEMTRADVEHFVGDVGLPEWERRWAPCLKQEAT